ncbi:Amino acid permease [Chitinispirillum alkaliphilum]|nr:Amino acid permease [Chitinispirillum alkaliphilum]
MIMVLYAFGGWSESAFIAAEMRDPKRSIPKALIASLGIITLVYLVTNLAYLFGLGFEELRTSSAPAAAVMGTVLGNWGATFISLIVIISVLGSINGTILTGSRVYAAMGKDHRIFSAMGRWSEKLATPVWAFFFQGCITIIMIFAVGTETGQNGLDRLLGVIGFESLPWSSYGGGGGTLVAGTAPVFWSFMLLTGISLFSLRWRDRNIKRVFSVPLYPVLPLIFCVTSVYMLYCSITYAKGLILFGVILMTLGVPFYWLGCTPQKR